MTPIISPLFFYLLSVVDSVRIICGIIGSFTGIALTVGFIGHWVVKHFPDGVYEDEDEDWLKIWKTTKRFCLVPAIIFITLGIGIPSRNTLIAMKATSYVTTENITKAVDLGGNFKDTIKADIIEIIEAMRGEKSENKTTD